MSGTTQSEIYLRDIYYELKHIREFLEKVTCKQSTTNDEKLPTVGARMRT